MINKIKDYSKAIFKQCFSLAITFIEVVFTIFFLVGAVCSMILLIKLYPDLAIKIIYPTMAIIKILWFVIILLIKLMCIFFLFWSGLWMMNKLQNIQEKARQRRIERENLEWEVKELREELARKSRRKKR